VTKSTLITHCGARTVNRDELAAVPTPPSTRTWFPVGHLTVLTTVEQTLRAAGFNPTREGLALSREGARFFATIDLESPLAPGVHLAVGLRNSLDKSLPIGFCAGSRVVVCDNLAFSSEVVVARKHTRFGRDRYTEALARAVGGLSDFQKAEAQRIERFQQTPVSDTEAESLMLRAYERDVVSYRLLPRVIAEWRAPSYEEFRTPTLWALMNAFTTVLGSRQRTNPQQFSHLTIRLSDLLNSTLPKANVSETEAVLSA
jgi:hypothetical protein